MRFLKAALLLGALLAAGALTARADVSIFDIQRGVVPESTVVECDGVVVTASGFWGFYVQEPVADPTYGYQYSGIWVYSNHTHSVHKGDLVNVKGLKYEYFGNSEIDVTKTGGFISTVGTGTIPDPVYVHMHDVCTGGTLSDAYQGVFIKVDSGDTSLYADSLSTVNEWFLRANADFSGDSLKIDMMSAGEDFAYDYPGKGTMLTWVQGILGFDHAEYKLAPRSCETDLGAACKPHLRGAWSTGQTTMTVEFGIPVDENSSENSYNYSLQTGDMVLTATRDPNNHKLVYLTTESLPNGAPERISVSNVLAESGGQMIPPGEFADFYSGITSIRSIQFVSNPNTNDASPLVNQVVTVDGRITAISASGNYYWLQDGDGTAWHGLYSRVAKNGNIAIGDRVQVAGQVTEYYNDTELNYKNGIDYFHNFGHSSTPINVNLVVASQIPFRGTKLAEPYEDCLVKITNATFKDSVAGANSPYFGEWLLRQETNPIFPDTVMTSLDYLFPVSYDVCVGNRVDLTGILGFAYNKYTMYPRTGRGGDIIEVYHASGCPITGVDPASGASGLVLDQNRPNPFMPETAIRFSLIRNSQVNLEVLDVGGRLVRTLISGGVTAGDHFARWDGTNQAGRPVAAGTYFYRLRSEGKELSRKMVRLQ